MGARKPRPPPAHRDRVRLGLLRIDRALAINPGEARYLAQRGALLHLAARLETDPVRRREEAARAAAELREALKANPLLEREYGVILRVP